MQFVIKRIKGIIIALSGMLFLLKNEDSIKVQSLFEISKNEWIIHIILIGFILSVEALNTVAEKICNVINPKYDSRIKLIKDIAAGAVSFAVISSLIVLLVIYYPYILNAF